MLAAISGFAVSGLSVGGFATGDLVFGGSGVSGAFREQDTKDSMINRKTAPVI
ncbi:hypothetical protein AGMMS50268_08360 [Spirochaetia bacterium]|nr:hypothetical protein AGMMS50268_08360 [Spirochaetia bacterium]